MSAWLVWHSDPPTITTAPTAIYRTGTSTTATTYEYNAPPRISPPSIPEINRRASLQAHADLVARARSRPVSGIASRARHGFAELAPLPCYRSTRTR